MSKNSTSAKSLKGYLLSVDSINIGNLTVDTITAPQLDFSGNITVLRELPLYDCKLTNCEIGLLGPSTGLFTTLGAQGDVTFYSADSTKKVIWDYATGTLRIIGDLIASNANLGNLKIYNNIITATNAIGDIQLVPTGVGRIYLNGPITNIVNSAGDFKTSLDNGNINMTSSDYIHLSSIYAGTTISSFSDQLYSSRNGDINIYTDTGIVLKSINSIIETGGNIRITSSTNSDLRVNDTITITGTNSNPSLNGTFTVKTILTTRSFLIDTNISSLIANGNTGNFIKSTSNNINLESNNINLISKNYITIPENVKLTFGITSSSTNLNNVYGNTSGMYINSQGDININVSSSNKIVIPQTSKLQFGTSVNNYINYDNSSLNLASNNITLSGSFAQINSATTKIYDMNPTIGDSTVTSNSTDRGIQYRYYSTSGSMKTGWFGVKGSTGQLTFVPDASNINNVISGNTGNFSINNIQASTITLESGGVISSTNTNSTNITTSNIYVNGMVTAGSFHGSNSTISNMVNANISTGALSASSANISNIVNTNISTGILLAITSISTGRLLASSSTIPNIVNTNISTGVLLASSSTIPNIVHTNISTGVLLASFSTITNIVSTNISSGILLGNSSTIPNVVHTNISTGILLASSSTVTNSVSTNISTGTLLAFTNISTGILLANTSTISNIVGTNISTSTLIGGSSIMTNMTSTNITTGAILAITNVSTGILLANSSTIPNIVHTNISTGVLLANSSTIPNIVNTNISSGVLLANSSTIPNIVNTNISTSTLISNNITSNNLLVTNIISTGNLYSINNTFANINVTAATVVNINVSNITTSTLLVDGISSSSLLSTYSTISNLYVINEITTNNMITTNLSSSNTITTNLNSTNIYSTLITTGTLYASGLIKSSSMNSDNLSTGYINTSSVTTGSLFVISAASLINNSNTLGSIITTGGNVGIGIVMPVAKLDIVGGINTTLGITTASIYVATMTSTANLSAVYATIPNIINTSISSGQINVNGSLYSLLISTGNIYTNNITIGNLYSNLVSTSNLYSLNITSASLTATTIVTTDTTSDIIKCDNLTINTELNSKGINNINLLNVIDNLNVNGSAVASISNLLTTNVTASNINSNGITTNNLNFTGNLYKNGVLYDASSSVTSDLGYLYEMSYVLDNDISVSTDITNFTFDATIKTFNSHIYVNNSIGCALHTINGLYDGSEWILSSSFVGDQTNINFYIRTENSNGIIQYTNTNSSGQTIIKYWTPTTILNDASSSQFNIQLSSDTTEFADIDPVFKFDNAIIDTVKIEMYISDEISSQYGIYFLNCILKDNSWSMNVSSIGKVAGIEFAILNTGGYGYIQYKNTNSHTISTRYIKKSLLKSQTSYTLLKNTLIQSNITNSDKSFIFKKTDYSFNMMVNVSIPLSSLYAIYEINGYICDGIWYLNYHSIGDNTGIEFFIDTTNRIGTLMYTNPNDNDASIKYSLDIPLRNKVTSGYTGNTSFLQNAILCGNGTDPIIGSNDLIFDDNNNQLILSNNSSIVINNINITPSIGDITKELSFSALNNQVSPLDVINFSFTNINIKSFTSIVCVTITTNSTVYDALYELKGINKNNGWNVYSSNVGDNLGITFSITSNGRIQYTSTNIPNWVSTRIKFRAMTTTI